MTEEWQHVDLNIWRREVERLHEQIAAEQEKVQRVSALVEDKRDHWQPEHRSITILEVEAALGNWVIA